MAQAMITGLMKNRKDGSTKVVVRAIDINENRLAELNKKGVEAQRELTKDVINETNVLVLAVKPQQTPDVLRKLTENPLQPNSLFVSVVAGLPIKRIADAKPGTNAIVRCMPNTPGSIGKGVTTWLPSPETPSAHYDTVRLILRAMGAEEKVKDEEAIDISTAVSGSGPAYVLLLMESMIDSACHMGLPRDLARKLVEETFIGTAEYAKVSKTHTAVLRDEITSPGGTTAAAMYMAEKGNFRSVSSDMMWAAYRRARELGGKPAVPGHTS